MTNDIEPPNQHPVVKPTNRARQGVTGVGVRYVLIFGMIAVISAFAVIFVVGGH